MAYVYTYDIHMHTHAHTQVMQGLEAKGSIVKALFRAGFAANQAAMRRGGRAKLWDMLLFKKLQSAVGGRLKIMLTGLCCALVGEKPLGLSPARMPAVMHAPVLSVWSELQSE
jgi:hypothetical protein